jgi:NADPH-dependent glutamate synthase beta subunit-like oxidoreductase
MLRFGLPRFRMNHDMLDREIETLRSMGIEFVTGKAFGSDISAESLRAEGFRSVFLGTGAHQGLRLNVPGEDKKGVISALSLLKDFYDNKQTGIGKKVVVVGGGNTAIDAARTAIRLGAGEVYITYRRTRDEMPATKAEIEEAEAEGIRIMYLVAPKSINSENGHVTGIRMVNHVLGEKDATDRRRPEEVNQAEFTLACDTVIAAIGQKPESGSVAGIEVDRHGMVIVDPVTGKTNYDGIYAGGDIARVDSIISSIASGKRAACSIDKFIAGKNSVLEYEPYHPVVQKENVLRRAGYFKDNGKIDLYTAGGRERVNSFSTYMRTLTLEEAVSEAKRCLDCGCGEGCAICFTICSDFAIHLKAPDVWEINKDECVACGMCYNMCPNSNIEMVNTNVLA